MEEGTNDLLMGDGRNDGDRGGRATIAGGRGRGGLGGRGAGRVGGNDGRVGEDIVSGDGAVEGDGSRIDGGRGGRVVVSGGRGRGRGREGGETAMQAGRMETMVEDGQLIDDVVVGDSRDDGGCGGRETVTGGRSAARGRVWWWVTVAKVAVAVV